MKIGELAKATETTVETIRFYEREGLINVPARTEGNYRIYGVAHVDRLNFVRHCRSLDMALDEIRALLEFRDSPAKNCGRVNALLDDHIEHVAARIRELRALQAQLKTLRQQCQDIAGAMDCKILTKLASTSRRSKGAAVRSHVRGTHS